MESFTFLSNSGKALDDFQGAARARHLEATRIFRAIMAMEVMDISTNSVDFPRDSTNSLLVGQLNDGGWADPEETAWAVAVLSRLFGKDNEAVHRATNWLESIRYPGGGWGRHPRDQARIPTTALVIALVPSVATVADREWVGQAWEKDLNSPVRLSYKGGFYLLTVNKEKGEPIDPLVSRTIAYLTEDQNDDGGFGPWRGHPIGNDPWSTGVVLWGLSKWIDNVDPKVIEKALSWLERTQLPSGYWAYHYLDEGTSYALIGAVSALKALRKL